MKRQFKLQKVLEFRERVLEKEKMRLADFVNGERLIAIRLIEINNEIRRKNREKEEDMAKGDFDFAQLYDKYIKLKEEEFAKIKVLHEETVKRIEMQKKVVAKALNDVKVMEKLKEKHNENYQEFMKKQEELLIDEINITKQHFKE